MGVEPQDVDSEWIRTHLGWDVRESQAVSVERIGTGKGLLGRVYRIRCAAAPTPASFVLKLPPPKGSTWDDFLATMAPFAREAEAYRLLERHRHRLHSILPRCYWSAYSDDGTGALALEDLGERHALMANVAYGLDLAQSQAAVHSLACLHATFAMTAPPSDPMQAPYPWIYSAISPELVSILSEAMGQCHKIATDRLSTELSRDSLRTIGKLDVGPCMDRSHRSSRLVSFCHGDAWANNVMFIPAGSLEGSLQAVLLDWQFPLWGNPLMDVAFLMLSSVNPTLLETHREELLHDYHAGLLAASPDGLDYSWEECRQDFARALEYGALMTCANLEAFVNDVTDAQLPVIARRIAAAAEYLPR